MQLLPVLDQLKTFDRRCSCFDEDCADVRDHWHCFSYTGLTTCANGVVVQNAPPDGYCPYLVGEAGPLNRAMQG